MFAELPWAYLENIATPMPVQYVTILTSTPNDDRCFIEVDRQRHSWRDGKAVIFDETTFAGRKINRSRRVLSLLCDIERPMKWRWAQSVNHWVGASLMSAASSPNDENDSDRCD